MYLFVVIRRLILKAVQSIVQLAELLRTQLENKNQNLKY